MTTTVLHFITTAATDYGLPIVIAEAVAVVLVGGYLLVKKVTR